VSEEDILPGHAFISYVRQDAAEVDQLQRALEAAGVQVWRDTTSLWPGEDWRANIRQAITGNALVFIACFSDNSLAREVSYQNEELVLAIDQMRLRPPDVPWLIPVRFAECDIPDRDIGGGRTLRSIQRADLFGDRSSEGTAQVVAAVLRLLGRSRKVHAEARVTWSGSGLGVASHILSAGQDSAVRPWQGSNSSRMSGKPRWESHSGKDGHVGQEWGPGDLVRAEAYYVSLADRARFVHDYLIDHPDQLVESDEFCRVRPADFPTRRSVSTCLSGLRRAWAESGRRYPFYWWAGKSGGPSSYAMKPLVAELFREARERTRS
jgi:hypothetical protein